MNDDEKAIREVAAMWLSATKAGDIETVLGLMTDDVVFMTPGQEPFGKEVFAASSEVMKDMRFDGTSEIAEIKIVGDWAWLRNRLRVVVTPPSGHPVVRSGYTLTVLTKNTQGKWQVARDANLMTVEAVPQ